MAGTCAPARGRPTAIGDAARVSWERARRIADGLPADDPDQLSMRIAPRTMLCATDWQEHRAVQDSRGRFAELRELCSAVAGDKVSLAMGSGLGPAAELVYAGRPREGSRLAWGQMALLESIGDPPRASGLAFIAFGDSFEAGEFGEMPRAVADHYIDLAAGGSTRGAGFWCGITAGVRAGMARRCSVVAGPSRMVPRLPRRRRDGPKQHPHNLRRRRRLDLRCCDLMRRAAGSWLPGSSHRGGDAGRARASDDVVLGRGRGPGLGGALLSRDAAADRRRGLELMVQVRDFWLRKQIGSSDGPDRRLVGRVVSGPGAATEMLPLR